MDAPTELQTTPPNSRLRCPSATVAACVMGVARWLHSLGLSREFSAAFAARTAPEIERIVTEAPGSLILVAPGPGGFWIVAGKDEADMEPFAQRALEAGAPLLGLNPALIEREAHGIANKGGPADASGRLH